MNYNLITAIIAIAAITSPILVAFIDNRYKLKQFDQKVTKERQYKEQERINEMIDSYLVSTSQLTIEIFSMVGDTLEYRKRYFALSPYMNEDSYSIMKDIDDSVSKKEWDKINSKLKLFVVSLNLKNNRYN